MRLLQRPADAFRILLLVSFLSPFPAAWSTPASPDSAEEPYWDGLSTRQKEVLLAGEPLLLEEEVPGNPWPRYIVYQITEGSPQQAAAIFWDLRLDPKYIPNCLSANIVNKPAPHIVEGEYTLKMPLFLPDEVYLSRNTLRRHNSGDYEISWIVQHSRYTKSARGNIRLQERDGKTLIRYSNLVEPGSRIAGILKNSAGNQVVASVKALGAQVARETARPKELLENQIRVVEEALAPGASSPQPPK